MNKKNWIINTLLSIHLILFSSLGHAKVNHHTQSAQQLGVATYYSDSYQGKRTASGEFYDKNKLTTVHKHYPFGTLLRVTNLKNNHSVIVKVNDRAPLRNNHVLDLSKQAAVELDFIKAGRAKVKIEAIQSDNT
ncbi:MAG: septal ring lytic transglycosylase RlpA family protein [Methylococcaceae bacterium]